LSELEREGIVERRRGAGTFVAAPQVQFNRLMSYTEHMSSRGLSARSRVLRAEVVESETQIAARLGLSADEKLVRIERLRLTAEERCALETCYLPAAKFSGLIKAPLERTSLFSILQHDYELELGYADEEIDAATADDAIARVLGLSRGSPVLRIRQVIHSKGGSATIYVVGFYRSEFHTLLVRRYR
jgi:GntR family transcriptional regulator